MVFKQQLEELGYYVLPELILSKECDAYKEL